jgi:hypothetical protein
MLHLLLDYYYYVSRLTLWCSNNSQRKLCYCLLAATAAATIRMNKLISSIHLQTLQPYNTKKRNPHLECYFENETQHKTERLISS